MTDPNPITCSLGASDLRLRLDEIAALGGASLIGRAVENGKHTLRFRSEPEVRRRLLKLVAAEAECCPFLELDLSERDAELILTLGATEDGQPVADELALALASASGGDARPAPSTTSPS